MADPVTASVGIGMNIAGAVVGAMGAKQSAEAQAGMYQYKAGVAQLNKQINLQNANWAIEAGESQAVVSGMKSRQQIAATKVAQAASGLDVNSGTGARVRQSQTDVAAYDQNVIRFNSQKTAYGYEAKAAADDAESKMDLKAADNAIEAGKLQVISSFISGASGVANKWQQGKMSGMFSSSSDNPYYGPLDYNG